MLENVPSEYVSSESPKDKPHSLAKEPSYIHFKQIVDYSPTVEIKKDAWVVDVRQGNQGKLVKLGRKRGSRGLFGWFDCAGKKKIVAMKFLVAVPATYDFLRSKKDGKWYKLAPSTTGVMAKMFRVLNPKKITKNVPNNQTGSDDDTPGETLNETPHVSRAETRSSAKRRSSAQSGVRVENVDTPGDTPDGSRHPSSGSLAAAPAALPAELPSPATPRTLLVKT